MDKKKLVYFVFFCFFIILVGCSQDYEENTENPMTAEEILTKEPDADIFMFNEFIYQANIDWVDEMTLISGEKIGEITEQAVDGHYNYTNGMANKLSVGATIYEVEEDNANENGINEGTNFILIVNDNGEEKYYLASTEG